MKQQCNSSNSNKRKRQLLVTRSEVVENFTSWPGKFMIRVLSPSSQHNSPSFLQSLRNTTCYLPITTCFIWSLVKRGENVAVEKELRVLHAVHRDREVINTPWRRNMTTRGGMRGIMLVFSLLSQKAEKFRWRFTDPLLLVSYISTIMSLLNGSFFHFWVILLWSPAVWIVCPPFCDVFLSSSSFLLHVRLCPLIERVSIVKRLLTRHLTVFIQGLSFFYFSGGILFYPISLFFTIVTGKTARQT